MNNAADTVESQQKAQYALEYPTNWAMTPAESLEHIKNVTSSEFPLGEF